VTAAEQYASQGEMASAREDIRDVWDELGKLREEVASLKTDVREIKTLLTERCAVREAAVTRDITMLETLTLRYQQAHKEIHAKCGARQEELMQRVASLERARMWMMGASAGIGAMTGLGSWVIASWFKLTGIGG